MLVDPKTCIRLFFVSRIRICFFLDPVGSDPDPDPPPWTLQAGERERVRGGHGDVRGGHEQLDTDDKTDCVS